MLISYIFIEKMKKILNFLKFYVYIYIFFGIVLYFGKTYLDYIYMYVCTHTHTHTHTHKIYITYIILYIYH